MERDTATENIDRGVPRVLKGDLECEGTVRAGTLNITVAPDAGATVVDVLIAGKPGERFDLEFTGNADFTELQNFTLIEIGDVISLLSQLQSTLAKLPGTQDRKSTRLNSSH